MAKDAPLPLSTNGPLPEVAIVSAAKKSTMAAANGTSARPGTGTGTRAAAASASVLHAAGSKAKVTMGMPSAGRMEGPERDRIVIWRFVCAQSQYQ